MARWILGSVGWFLGSGFRDRGYCGLVLGRDKGEREMTRKRERERSEIEMEWAWRSFLVRVSGFREMGKKKNDGRCRQH